MRLVINYSIGGTGLQKFEALLEARFFHIMWGQIRPKVAAITEVPIVSSE
jgi:hypothetical protein